MFYSPQIDDAPTLPWSRYKGQLKGAKLTAAIKRVFGEPAFTVLTAFEKRACQILERFGDQSKRFTVKDAKRGEIVPAMVLTEFDKCVDHLHELGVVCRRNVHPNSTEFWIDYIALHSYLEDGKVVPVPPFPLPEWLSPFKSSVPAEKLEARILAVLGADQFKMFAFIADKLHEFGSVFQGQGRMVVIGDTDLSAAFDLTPRAMVDIRKELLKKKVVERIGQEFQPSDSFYSVDWKNLRALVEEDAE